MIISGSEKPYAITSDEHEEPWIPEEVARIFPDHIHVSGGDRADKGSDAHALYDIYAERKAKGEAYGVYGNHDLTMLWAKADAADWSSGLGVDTHFWYNEFAMNTFASYGIDWDRDAESEEKRAHINALWQEMKVANHVAAVVENPIYLELVDNDPEIAQRDMLVIHAGLGATAWSYVRKAHDELAEKYQKGIDLPQEYAEMPPVLSDTERASHVESSPSSEGKLLLTGHAHMDKEGCDRVSPDGLRVALANNHQKEERAFVYLSDRDQLVVMKKPQPTIIEL